MKTEATRSLLIAGLVAAFSAMTSIGCSTVQNTPEDQARLEKVERHIDRYEVKTKSTDSVNVE